VIRNRVIAFNLMNHVTYHMQQQQKTSLRRDTDMCPLGLITIYMCVSSYMVATTDRCSGWFIVTVVATLGDLSSWW